LKTVTFFPFYNGFPFTFWPQCVKLGSRLQTVEGDVYGCYNNHTPGNRESFFVKLTLYLNTNMQRGSRMKMEYLVYFGTVITYFRYKLQGDKQRLLALVRIYNVERKNTEIWPYKVPSDKGRLVVVHVDSIIDLCLRNKGPNDTEYICYNHKREHNLHFGKLKYV
jgi:hypothetical protein